MRLTRLILWCLLRALLAAVVFTAMAAAAIASMGRP
jgi:hypothetical protein